MGVPWDFAIQARGHHNTEKLGDNCKLWLEKHVLGKGIFWPARPKSEIKLDSQGVPELVITPASPDKIKELKIYYALKNPVSFGRAWRDTKAVGKDGTWTAKMPVLNVDDYLFAYANIRYDNNAVVSSDFEAVIPSMLGKAVATDTKSDVIEGTGQWQRVGPVEGVGGVKGFRALNKHRGIVNEQFSDPKWKAPKGAELALKFYCAQPQKLIFKANNHWHAEIEMTASNDWQRMIIPAKQMKNRFNKQPLKDWSEVKSVGIVPAQGADITKVIFADFKWVNSK